MSKSFVYANLETLRDMKGQGMSYQEMAEASGYKGRVDSLERAYEFVHNEIPARNNDGMKQVISDNFSEVSAMKKNRGWRNVSLHYGFIDHDSFRALFHEVHAEKSKIAKSNVVTSTMLIDWKMRNLSKSEILLLPEGKSLNYEAIRSAERRYRVQLVKRPRVVSSSKSFTDNEIIEAFNIGGKNAVANMYDEAGMAKTTFYKRLARLADAGLIDYKSSGGKHEYHASPRKSIDVDDTVPLSMQVPKEVRSIVMGAWR